MARYTGLILITGAKEASETAEIESKFREVLSAFAIDVIDQKSMQIRDRYFLAIYIKLDKAHQKAIEKDLTESAMSLNLDLAIDFKDE